MAKWVCLVLVLVLANLVQAQDNSPSRLFRARLSRGRPENEDDSERAERQLPSRIRTRSRVRRPPIVRPGDLDNEEDSNGFTLSRNPSRLSDDFEADQPRFIPSRGGNPSAALTRNPSSSSSRNSISAPKLSSPNEDGYKLVCYYTNWSQYRPKKGKYLPENIDPFLCTHIIFAFGWIKDGKLSSFESNDVSGDGKLGLYQRVVGLKAKNPKLKVMLAIGGWSFGTAKFKQVAETRFSRQTFIFSAIPFLRKHNFDGEYTLHKYTIYTYRF